MIKEDIYNNFNNKQMDIILTRNVINFNDGNDNSEQLVETIKKQKKYYFIYDGIKFISNKEIIGVEPKTYKLIYKNNN